jgi:Tfp pilus assembly protein PilN
MVLAGAAVGLFALLLVGAAVMRGNEVSRTKADERSEQAATASVNGQITGLADIQKVQTDIAAKQGEVALALRGDLAWPTMIQDVSSALPTTVGLTSLSATAATATQAGRITLAGVAADHTDVAAFLEGLGTVKVVAKVWLSSSTRSGVTGPVSFSATAELTDAARSDRATTFGGTR